MLYGHTKLKQTDILYDDTNKPIWHKRSAKLFIMIIHVTKLVN